MEVYVDGSCCGNGKFPNKAGYGVIAFENEKVVFAYSHQEENSTNNRQEMKAILYALIRYGKLEKIVDVFSDSAYAINSFTIWSKNWKSNGWVKSDNKPPENLDLIKAYDKLVGEGYRINLQKVSGHSENKKNNLVDKLATGKITEKEIYEKYG